MNQELRENLASRSMWTRGLYMLVYLLAVSVAGTVLSAVVLVQFGVALVTGHRNDALADFGGELSRYVYDLMLFLTFNSERRPFPFHDEPRAAGPAGSGGDPARRDPPIPPASLLRNG